MKLKLDYRKHNLFVIEGYRQLPEGHTPESIFNYRLEEARQHMKYSHFKENFPPEEFPRMLCLGAGTGAEVLAAKEYGYDAVGVGILGDIQRTYAESRGVDFRLMDMHDLKFPNESFDVVYAKYSFEHCVNPWLVCAEVYAVLRDYGRWFLLLDPYQATAGASGPKMIHYMILKPWFMNPMFKRSGFRILWMDDSPIRYHYLLEKLPFDKMEVKYDIKPILKARLELGREYK
ncbi:MAG: class I SAM-dependent methyltransferase [Thermoplasmata archaeon]|nr:class I SAM-dependent methyltransferase [Thermoplasmata archaeon]